jgi:hypothetical protein
LEAKQGGLFAESHLCSLLAPCLTDRKEFLQDVVKPLQDKAETIYVAPGSDPEEHVARRFPHKKTKRVANGLAGQGSIGDFLRGLPFVFQRGQSEGLNATYHFIFTGQGELKATIIIRNKTLQVSEGCKGAADLRIAKPGFASCEKKQISCGPYSEGKFGFTALVGSCSPSAAVSRRDNRCGE